MKQHPGVCLFLVRESQITDLTKLHSHLGQEKCDALVGLHPFSGCDTVSALYGLQC